LATLMKMSLKNNLKTLFVFYDTNKTIAILTSR